MTSTSSYFAGTMRINGRDVKSIYIRDSTIADTNIDMGNKKITSLSNPSNPYDAATKLYVDMRSQLGISTYTCSLIGSQWSDVVNLNSGSYTVMVNSLVLGGPTATFMISKSYSEIDANVQRTTNSRAKSTGERLNLRWNANEPITLSKDGIYYDGMYSIKIV